LNRISTSDAPLRYHKRAYSILILIRRYCRR
jgi:hypothetical protein